MRVNAYIVINNPMNAKKCIKELRHALIILVVVQYWYFEKIPFSPKVKNYWVSFAPDSDLGEVLLGR